MVTIIKLFIDNMNVYLKNLRKSREKLVETVIKFEKSDKLIILYIKIR